MRKLIIILMTTFILVGCSKKDTPLDQLFTDDSAFGVKRGMTYDELSKIISLKEISRTDYSVVYISSNSPLQNSFFLDYTYRFGQDNKIYSVNAAKNIKGIKNGDGSKIRDDYQKILHAVNSKFSQYKQGDGCANPIKFKNKKQLLESDNQNDYDMVMPCNQKYYNNRPFLSVRVYYGANWVRDIEYTGIIYDFN